MNVIQNRNAAIFKAILFAAAIYHLAWAIFAITFPESFFILAKIPVPQYIEMWQLVGLYTGVLGIGYLLAAFNPIRHWRIVLLGFTIKFIIALCFINSVLHQNENSIVYKMITFNHLIWLPLFALILYNAYKHQYLLDNELIRMNHLSVDELLEMYVTNKQNSVLELAKNQPVMLVFLRHFGCAFCKESLTHISQQRAQIEAQGTKIVLVNMQDEIKCEQELEKYELEGIEFIADQESLLYKAFRLKRGTIKQLFGFKVLSRGIYIRLVNAFKTTRPEGADIFQMPGVFVIYKGAIVNQFIYESVADKPSYIELATI